MIEDATGDPSLFTMLAVAYGLLKAHGWTSAIVFWCADGEDGFKTPYGAYARPRGDGNATLTLRQLVGGGLDPKTTTS